MPEQQAFSGTVTHLQILDKDGNVDKDLEPDLSEDELKDMYWHMVLARTYDEKAIKMQRQGRFGTYAPCKGQEAAQVGSAYAMDETDWMFPAFRETAAYFVRDFPMEKLTQYWQGDERGSADPENPRNFMVSVPVGSQLPHAVGAAMAAKKQGDPIATLVYFGDGATSEGDFHEGMNFAGAFEAPTVFVCQNNQYAISVPRDEQTGAETLAQKALAYGFEGIQVDGNDILAMWKATKEALQKARQDGEPTMIEAVTYRRGDHTTADDADRYRDEEEVEYWRERDPIERFETYLKDKGIADDNWFREQHEKAEKEVKEAMNKAEDVDPPDLKDIFQYHYEEMPPELQQQYEQLTDVEGDN
jgi:pyruvate dehydrogenase E1 component alpha subunit